MRLTTTNIALLALPALIHANSVALIDFVPRVSDVSSGCNKVYQQKIPDCDSKDFTQQECSPACVRGLESMTKDVKNACGNEGLQDRGGEPNVLAVFLADRGPSNLCANADEVLSSKPSSSAAATTSSEKTSTTSSSAESSTTSEESTTSVASSTATASSGDVPTSLVMDTSASPGSTTSATSTDSDTSATESSSQIFQAPSMPPTFASANPTSEPTGHSGGGSPFDAADAQFSAGAASSLSAWLLVVAAAFAGFAAQW